MVHVSMTTPSNLNAMFSFIMEICQSAKIKRVGESFLLDMDNCFMVGFKFQQWHWVLRLSHTIV
jgi:hypothetical protein